MTDSGARYANKHLIHYRRQTMVNGAYTKDVSIGIGPGEEKDGMYVAVHNAIGTHMAQLDATGTEDFISWMSQIHRAILCKDKAVQQAFDFDETSLRIEIDEAEYSALLHITRGDATQTCSIPFVWLVAVSNALDNAHHVLCKLNDDHCQELKKYEERGLV